LKTEEYYINYAVKGQLSTGTKLFDKCEKMIYQQFKNNARYAYKKEYIESQIKRLNKFAIGTEE